VYYDSDSPIQQALVKEPAPTSGVRAAHHAGSTLQLAARPTAAVASLSASQDLGHSQQALLPAAIKIESLAGVMEGWAAALPRWDAQVTEPWFTFVERAYEAETALAERLRRLPTCRLFMCPIRQDVTLSLAGISIESDQGLAGACRAWARSARERGAG